MSPEQRGAGLAAAARARRGELLGLAERLAAAHQLVLLEAPVPRAVMLEVATAAGDFCLTEVVVTTALVRLDGDEGWACVMGWDDEGALAAATCAASSDAAVGVLVEGALDDERESARTQAAAVVATRLGR